MCIVPLDRYHRIEVFHRLTAESYNSFFNICGQPTGPAVRVDQYGNERLRHSCPRAAPVDS